MTEAIGQVIESGVRYKKLFNITTNIIDGGEGHCYVRLEKSGYVFTIDKIIDKINKKEGVWNFDLINFELPEVKKSQKNFTVKKRA